MVIVKVVDHILDSEYNRRVKLCIEIDHNVGFRKNQFRLFFISKSKQ